jgi:DivIVA domain-containing protein
MAAIRLDHPVLISSQQIRRREFVTTRRGYDPEQVRRYLEELADQVDVMASMIREARLEADTAMRAGAQPHPDPYEQLADRVTSVIREADETAERLRTEGHGEAERILAEARADAERIRTEAEAAAEQARTEAERTLHHAKHQADQTISGLSTRRQALVDQLAQMQQRLLGVARDLEVAIEQPLQETVAEGSALAASEGEPVAEVVDVRTGVEPPPPPPGSTVIVADEVLDERDDPGTDSLWEGQESIQLEVPDIPPLDLSWGDEDDR